MSPRLCGIDECERAHYARGWCVTHYRRWQRDRDVRADSPVAERSRNGEGYSVVMRRLRLQRGLATAQACTDCAAPAACWSYDGTDPQPRVHPSRGVPYSLDLSRYLARCWRCHRLAVAARHRDFDIGRAAALYQAGASCAGIGALLGASAATTRRALQSHSVPIRPTGHHKNTD